MTGISQPGLSQQLGVLRKAGLVETRKEAKLVYYSIATGQIATVTAALAALSPGTDHCGRGEPAAMRTPAPGVANFARMS